MVNDLKHGDSNGTLDLDEFHAFCIDELRLNQTDKDVRLAFRYLDVDRSGSIDVEEIVDEVMVIGSPSRMSTPIPSPVGSRSGSKGFALLQQSARPSTTPRNFRQNIPDMKSKSGIMEKRVLLKLERKVILSGKRQFSSQHNPAGPRTAPWERKTIADVSVTPRAQVEAPSSSTGSRQSLDVYAKQRRALPGAGKLLTAEATSQFIAQEARAGPRADVENARGHSWFHRQIF
jgi:hypothetical protein